MSAEDGRRRGRGGAWMLALMALTAAGCAGTRPHAAPAPYSSFLAARLAWDESGAPLYRIVLALPARDLERAAATDNVVRLIVSAQVTKGSGKVLRSRVWTEQLERAPLAAALEHPGAFELGTAPGTQDLTLGVLVQGQTYGRPWRRRFHVPEPGPDALFLGEPEFLGCEPTPTDADSCPRRPQVGGYFDAQTGAPRFRSTVYDFAPPLPGAMYSLDYVLRDLEGAGGEPAVLEGGTIITRAGLATPVEVALPMLSLGRYVLELRLRAGERSATTQGVFEVGLTDLAGLGGGEGGVELLRLLLPAADADAVLAAPAAGREAVWEDCWRRLDPDPATPENELRDEMLQRLRFANVHYSTTISGWRSARGRVYVRRGAPDRIDVLQNSEGFDRFERWTYKPSNEVFLFVDRDGRGEYTLLRTNATEPF